MTKLFCTMRLFARKKSRFKINTCFISWFNEEGWYVLGKLHTKKKTTPFHVCVRESDIFSGNIQNLYSVEQEFLYRSFDQVIQ